MSPMAFAGRSDQAGAAEQRRRDATTLLSGKRWLGSIYMMGYAIECALKAKLMRIHDELDLTKLQAKLSERRGTAIELQTHSLEYLFNLLEVKDRMSDSREGIAVRNALAYCNSKWSSELRYSRRDGTEDECTDFLENAERLLTFIAGSV